MSYVVINAIAGPSGRGEELEARFSIRAGEVSGADGFQSFRLLRLDNHAAGGRYLVPTQWDCGQEFQNRMEGSALARGHASSGATTPVATESGVREYEVVQEKTA